MRLKLSQVVGHPSAQVWSQAVVLSTEAVQGKELDQLTGGVAVVAITVRDAEEPVVKGGALVHQLEEALIREGRWLQATEIFERLARMDMTGIELMGVYLSGKRMVLFGYGGGKGILKRDDKTGVIFEGTENKWVVKEGKLEVGDRWLVGTAGLVGEMENELIAELLDYGQVEAAGEELVTQVQAAEASADAAGAFMAIEEGEELVEPEPETKVIEVEKPEKKAEAPPTVYVKSMVKRQKTALSVGVLLLVMLLVSVWFGWQKRQEQMWRERFEGVVSQVDERTSQVEQVKGNNPLQAKQLVMEAQQIVSESVEVFAEHEEYQRQLQERLEELSRLYAEVSGERKLGEVPVWYELALLREGMFGSEIDITEGRLLILDGELGILGAVELQTKQATLVGGGELLRGGESVAVRATRGVVYGDAGVVEVLTDNRTTAVLVEPGDWGKIEGVGLFSGNVYLLDAGTSEIWQYPGLERGVGERRRWLAAGYTPDLTKAVDMRIDGDIWVLERDGTVKRFRQGNEENFAMKGLDEPVREGVAVYTGENLDRVYVLDRSMARVVVVTKTGEYVAQYQWDGWAAAVDIAVDEEETGLYGLVGSSIYRMELNQ